MGYALAEAARDRGAQVVLVSGPTALQRPSGVEIVPVTTAHEMAAALRMHFDWATVVIMAAAVADYRPKAPAPHKIKKRHQRVLSLDLEPAPDILAMLSAQRTSQLLVGFAAETEHLVVHAKEKLAAKGLDLIVANDVTQEGAGFGSDHNAVVVLSRTGQQKDVPLMPKRRLADEILTAVIDFDRPHVAGQPSIAVE
jgi:phosphopantothenoylcysteine decarboxylase / phosphopantothenate---cysteine ligase